MFVRKIIKLLVHLKSSRVLLTLVDVRITLARSDNFSYWRSSIST